MVPIVRLRPTAQSIVLSLFSLCFILTRSVTGELPGLLKWSSAEQAFVCVDRVSPSLPQLSQSSVVVVAPEMEEISTSEPEISAERSKDTQNKGVEIGSRDPPEVNGKGVRNCTFVVHYYGLMKIGVRVRLLAPLV